MLRATLRATLPILLLVASQATHAGERPGIRTVYFPPSRVAASTDCDDDKGPGPVKMLSKLESSWYARHLAAAEPSLYLASLKPRRGAGEIVRFTWLRSFHPTVIVRVEMTGQAARLIATQLSGDGGYSPGTVARRLNRQLTRKRRPG